MSTNKSTRSRQVFFLKKLAICLTSNFITDFYEIDHGDSKSVVGPKKFDTEVTWFVTSSVIYKKLLKRQNKVISEVKMI
jgi:hypothetical protein